MTVINPSPMIAAVNCARALDALFQWLSPTSPHRASLDADERRAPLTGQPVRGAFSCDCLGKRRQRSAPINRVSRFDGRHKQRPYSLGRIVMPLIHERGFPLLNPKLARHLGRTLRLNRIEHANTLAYRSRKRSSSFHDEHCRIADDATKPRITRASAAALQPNQAIPA